MNATASQLFDHTSRPSPRRMSFLMAVHWRWIDLFVGVVPIAVVGFVSALGHFIKNLPVPSWHFLPLALLQSAWLLGYPLWIARRRERLRYLPRGSSVFIEALVAVLAFALLNVILIGIFSFVLRRLGAGPILDNPFERLARELTSFERYGFMLQSVLLAPIAEEVFFRGMIYSFLRQRSPLIVAIVLQAVIFGLAHAVDLPNTLRTAISGAVFGLLYEWRKTLLAPTLLHTVVNGVATLNLMLAMTAQPGAVH
jgi:membrane protease YdiL (CAAX protease family)